MVGIFFEEFFIEALFWLFVCVTLFQMAFAGAVLWLFKGGAELEATDFERGGLWRIPRGQTTEKVVRPRGEGQSSMEGSNAIPMEFQGVSVIVCARNEANNLEQHLPAMLAQQYPGAWELIIVNDASTDNTSAVLLDFQRDQPHLRILKIEEKKQAGKKQALAAGIAAAKYENILLSDADCKPVSQYWLRLMIGPMLVEPDIEIVLGYGPMKKTKNGGFLESWTRFETAFTALLYGTFAGAGLPYMGVGRNLAFKKAIFERVGGFAAHLHIASGDDDLLVNAAANAQNTVFSLHPESFVYSSGKQSWAAWARQKKRHLSAGTAYKWQHQVLLGLLSLSHTLHFFLLFLLLFIGAAEKTILYLWLTRYLFLFFMYRKVFSILRESDLLSRLPIFDALLAVYYGALIPRFLIGNKTQSWR